MDVEAVLAAAVKREIAAVLRLIESDPHQWSARPCQTCRAVSTLAGRAFGCEAVRIRREREEG